MNSIVVGVLRGGPSYEYDVSLRSGTEVINALSDRYQCKDIFISKDGVWHLDGIAYTPTQILKKVDVVFNALHGEYGEDGKVQKILDDHMIPYTGSKALASAVGMNKAQTKDILRKYGIRMPVHMVLKKEDVSSEKVRDVFRTFPQPSVVKPVWGGSSCGVYFVQTEQELVQALTKAFAYAEKVIVEEYIEGKEATCGVIDAFRGEDRYTTLPSEIIYTGANVWGYESKYDDALHTISSSGRFTSAESDELRRVTQDVHDILGCRHYSRSDFIVHPKRGVYFFEANTHPGLTRTSLLPHALAEAGSDMSEFVVHIIQQALDSE